MWVFSKDKKKEDERDSDQINNSVMYIPIEKIKTGNFQPRFMIDQDELKELMASIKEVGVLQPVLVRPKDDYYELIAGERRLRASVMAGLNQIPVVIRDLSDNEAAEIALIENLQRKSLHFFEEAEGYARLIKEFNMTQVEVAKRMGISQSAVANKLRLLKLDPTVRDRIYKLKLSERHARALLDVTNVDMQLKLLECAAIRDYSVAEWEDLIKHEKSKNISQEINKSKKMKVKPLVRDLRLFINSLEKGVETLRAAGLDVYLHHERDGNILRVVIEVDAGV